MTDSNWFKADWRTPAQTRDLLIEMAYPVTTKRIQELRAAAEIETNRRKESGEHIQCPMCKGWHGQKHNIDGLCEIHEAQTAPMRWDAKNPAKP